jgi:hypothetical protein
MSDFKPIEMQDPRRKNRASSSQAGRKIMIGSLAILLVSSMVAWCGLLGWGLVEALRLAATAIYKLWLTFV